MTKFLQYAGSPDIFDEKGQYVKTVDWNVIYKKVELKADL